MKAEVLFLRKFSLAVIVIWVAALLMACAPQAAPTPTPTKAPAPTAPPAAPVKAAAPTATPAPVTLKFGHIGSASDVGVYVGLEKGFFKEEGINVQVESFRFSDDMIAPLGTGQVDVGHVLVKPAVLNAADRGVDLRVVADKGQTAPGFEFVWIMLRKDLKDSGQVKTYADLKGMKIATIGEADICHQVVDSMLVEGKLSVKDVELIQLAPPEYIGAFSNKGIAAGCTIEPFVALIGQQDLAVKWVPASKYFGGRSVAAMLAYSTNMVKNTDVGRRWMVAYLKGVRAYLDGLKTKEGVADLVGIMAKYTPIKEAKLFDAMEKPYVEPNGVVDRNSIDIAYKWLVSKGFYTGKKTFNDLIDTSFIDYAVQKLGKYQ